MNNVGERGGLRHDNERCPIMPSTDILSCGNLDQITETKYSISASYSADSKPYNSSTRFPSTKPMPKADRSKRGRKERDPEITVPTPLPSATKCKRLEVMPAGRVQEPTGAPRPN